MADGLFGTGPRIREERVRLGRRAGLGRDDEERAQRIQIVERRGDELGIGRIEDPQLGVALGRAEGSAGTRPARGCCRPSRRGRRSRSPTRRSSRRSPRGWRSGSRIPRGRRASPAAARWPPGRAGRSTRAWCRGRTGASPSPPTEPARRPLRTRPCLAEGKSGKGSGRRRGIGHRYLRASSPSMVRPPIRSGRDRRRRVRSTPGSPVLSDGCSPPSPRWPGCSVGIRPRRPSRATRRATSVTRSTVNPNSLKTVPAGAEAPKWSSPTIAPSSPTQRSQPSGHAGLDAHAAPDGWRQDLVAIRLVLGLEHLPARQRHDARANSLGLEGLGRAHGQLQLGARADEDQLGVATARVAQHVAAARDALARLLGRAGERRQLLARQRQADRPASSRDGQRPRGDRLVGIARPDEPQVRDRTERRVVLDRLVRRAVLAQPDRVVRPDVEDVQVGQRREADRPAHVVAERQERAAVGMNPPW